jgi:hypothetical protein
LAGGSFAFTSGNIGTGTQAWTKEVDVYGPNDGHDWDNNPSLAGNQEANGEDLKNALQAFNSGNLVTTLSGTQVGYFNGSFVDFSHSNTIDQFWLTLHEAGLI